VLPLQVTSCIENSTFPKLDNHYLPVRSKLKWVKQLISSSLCTPIFQHQMQLKSTGWSSLDTTTPVM
jgi:hypothetical protein